MVDSLFALPKNSAAHRELTGYLHEVVDALLAVQDEAGMWHQLMNLPPAKSYPDSTGTGFISGYVARAFAGGLLTDEKYKQAAIRAFDALANYVSPQGHVLQACPGPGPLYSLDDYLETPGKTEDGVGHGPGCVLFACAGRWLLTKE